MHYTSLSEMNSILLSARRMASVAAHARKTGYKSCLFALLNRRGNEVVRHPLDTTVDEYYKVINDIVIPTCSDLSPYLKGYSERVKQMLTHTLPAYPDALNFAVELAYRTVAPPEHQTEENLTKMRIVRACMDLYWTSGAMVDDIVDHTDIRNDKPAWHLICEGGISAANYDYAIMSFLPFQILERLYKDAPGHRLMVDLFLNGNLRSLVGSQMDLLGQGAEQTKEQLQNIMVYKSGSIVCQQQPLGFIHAGILDRDIIEQALGINLRFGVLLQIWDDFIDYYHVSNDSQGPCYDIKNGTTNWVSFTALNHFTPAQAKRFKENYGSKDPEKIRKVIELYEEVDIPALYEESIRTHYREISALIARVPHPKVRESLISQLDWWIGDVKE